MLEDNDYRRIADQLYLLPFLRKYAEFLDIDPDETAMRLLRDVQRVDNSPSVRLDEPLDGRRYRRRNWSKPIIFGGLVAVIVGAYIVQSRRADTDNTVAATRVHPSEAPSGTASSLALKGTTDSLSAVQPSTTGPAFGSDPRVTQQTTLATKIPTHTGVEVLPQAVVTQARSAGGASKPERGKRSGVSNH
jgi:cytoskeletal protein RodZ